MVFTKKGEMQMYETILVLVVIFIIIGILLLVFGNYNKNSIQNIQFDIERDAAFNLLYSLPNSEYMVYTYLGDQKGMIDSAKLLGVEIDNLGYKEIIVEEFSNNTIKCVRNNYPNCNYYEVYSKIPRRISSKQEVSRSVLVYNPFTKKSNPGKLIVRWY